MSSESLTNNAHLYEVTSDAAKWRDMDDSKIRNEKIFKIGMIAGGILLLLGSAIAICLGATLLTGTGRILCIADSVGFGVGVGIGMVVTGILVNFERRQNGKGSSFSKSEEQAELIHLLANGQFQELRTQCYRKGGGGLGPLVRKGLITVDQGDKLRVLMKKYVQYQQSVNDYESQPNTKQKIDNNKDVPKGYDDARCKVDEVKSQWKILQKAFNNQYKREA